VALQAGLIRGSGGQLSRIAWVRTAFCPAAFFGMFGAVGVADLTRGRPRIGQEFCALSMRLENEIIDGRTVALHTVLSNFRRFSS